MTHGKAAALVAAATIVVSGACAPPPPKAQLLPPLVIIDEFAEGGPVDVHPPQVLEIRMRIEITNPPVAVRCANYGGYLEDDGDDGATCVGVDY